MSRDREMSKTELEALDRINKFDPERAIPGEAGDDFEGRAYKSAIESSLHELDGYADDDLLLVASEEDEGSDAKCWRTLKAGEASKLIRDMRNPNNDLTHGRVYSLVVISDEPEHYMRDLADKLERKKFSLLEKLEGHAEADVVWYSTGERWGDRLAYKTTVKEMRSMISGLTLSNPLFYSSLDIISVGDPTFVPPYPIEK